MVETPAEEAMEELCVEKSPENTTQAQKKSPEISAQEVVEEPAKEESKNLPEEIENVPAVESQDDGENKEEKPDEAENEMVVAEKVAETDVASQDDQKAAGGEDGSLNGSMDLFSTDEVQQEPAPADESISSGDHPRSTILYFEDQPEKVISQGVYEVDITNRAHPLYLSSAEDSQSSQGSQSSSIPSLGNSKDEFLNTIFFFAFRRRPSRLPLTVELLENQAKLQRSLLNEEILIPTLQCKLYTHAHTLIAQEKILTCFH